MIKILSVVWKCRKYLVYIVCAVSVGLTFYLYKSKNKVVTGGTATTEQDNTKIRNDYEVHVTDNGNITIISKKKKTSTVEGGGSPLSVIKSSYTLTNTSTGTTNTNNITDNNNLNNIIISTYNTSNQYYNIKTNFYTYKFGDIKIDNYTDIEAEKAKDKELSKWYKMTHDIQYVSTPIIIQTSSNTFETIETTGLVVNNKISGFVLHPMIIGLISNQPEIALGTPLFFYRMMNIGTGIGSGRTLFLSVGWELKRYSKYLNNSFVIGSYGYNLKGQDKRIGLGLGIVL